VADTLLHSRTVGAALVVAVVVLFVARDALRVTRRGAAVTLGLSVAAAFAFAALCGIVIARFVVMHG
jgi:hypothetical protein